MNNLRVSKTVSEYKANLIVYGEKLKNISEVEVKISEHEYASFIYAKKEFNAVEIMEDDSGVWVEFWKVDADEAHHDTSYNSYEDAYTPIEKWLADENKNT